MAKVRVSPRAATDLQEIWISVALDNLPAAERIEVSIRNKIARLADFPEMGSPRPDIAPTARMLVAGNYLVLYETADDGVVIVRVVHGARNLDDLL